METRVVDASGCINILGEEWYRTDVASLVALDLATLLRWLEEGVGEATDGWLVAPDA